MESCSFAQLLKVVHSVVSDRCFFAPLGKAIGSSACKRSLNVSTELYRLVFLYWIVL
jgi:hypothetical protein